MKTILKILFILFSSATYPGLVDIERVDKTIKKDIRYFSKYNFVGEFIDGYKAPKCLLEESAAMALSKVQKELSAKAMSLLVYDCYRPQKAVDHFIRWSQSETNEMKVAFYPNLKKENLFKLGYIAKQSGHTTGRSVDLTLISLDSSIKIYRDENIMTNCASENHFKDNSLDMGSAYDCFHEISHTQTHLISEQQMKNRLLLKEVMEKYGFYNYSKEWWHYTFMSKNPKRYNQDVE